MSEQDIQIDEATRQRNKLAELNVTSLGDLTRIARENNSGASYQGAVLRDIFSVEDSQLIRNVSTLHVDAVGNKIFELMPVEGS